MAIRSKNHNWLGSSTTHHLHIFQLMSLVITTIHYWLLLMKNYFFPVWRCTIILYRWRWLIILCPLNWTTTNETLFLCGVWFPTVVLLKERLCDDFVTLIYFLSRIFEKFVWRFKCNIMWNTFYFHRIYGWNTL